MADETLRINSTFAEYLRPPPVDESKPHQIVRLYNSCNQTHVVFDRGHKPITIQPGQRVTADLLVEAIEGLRKQRAEPRPLVPRYGDRGQMTLQPAPKHPVIIEDVPALASGPEPETPAAVTLVDDTELLGKMNAMAAANERH
jgi:hypothetical protein